MRKIHFYMAALLAATISLSSCNDEWEDELYTHMVSLKAPVGSEGVCDIYLHYKVDGEVIYDLPVLRSGSTLSDEAVDVRIGVDPDTLNTFNMEKYQYRDDLYFKLLTEQYYEFLSPTCHIPAGSNKELFQIKFKFSGLDLSREWVLPLTIEDDPSYVSNHRKGWRKALLHVLPFNDYSGKYAGNQLQITMVDAPEGEGQMQINEHRSFVVDENTIFFYMGHRDIDYLDRKNYKVFVRFTDEEIEGKQLGAKRLELWSDNEENNKFVPDADPYYVMWEEMDATEVYTKHIYIILYLGYSYEDYTTAPGTRIAYTVSGNLSMQRDLNTLIPDEDQQIQW